MEGEAPPAGASAQSGDAAFIEQLRANAPSDPKAQVDYFVTCLGHLRVNFTDDHPNVRTTRAALIAARAALRAALPLPERIEAASLRVSARASTFKRYSRMISQDEH